MRWRRQTWPHVLADLGRGLGRLGRRAEAIAALAEATSAMEQFDTVYLQGSALEALAALLAEEGRVAESRRTYARAAQIIFQAVGDAEAYLRCRDLAAAP
ncbi:hypothetical protein [Streptomyces sp. CMB-StM0423]|uniref:hypothetical protein n=1 Tax=Streptomyces sp. CMB-StM0423 TaxID=2059884 RepID=UPI000C7067A6|nr:hypothetical protein [Streptomyces sp. CMB-StM0423]AUH40034.1 hypothetical protein CXR04_07055 [Streptomyces sp. CMB-StM0423]